MEYFERDILVTCKIFMATTNCNIYIEASTILLTHKSGSLKSRIYSTHNAPQKSRTSPSRLYALTMESLKYQDILNEVIKNSGILTTEKKVCIGIYGELTSSSRCWLTLPVAQPDYHITTTSRLSSSKTWERLYSPLCKPSPKGCNFAAQSTPKCRIYTVETASGFPYN